MNETESPKIFLPGLISSLIFAVACFFLWPVMVKDPLQGAAWASIMVLLGGLLQLLSIRLLNRAKPKKMVTLFVGNLAFKADRNRLRQLVGQFGETQSVRIILDKHTRKPKGFGFVEIEEGAAHAAIDGLNGKVFLGRELKVSVADQQR